MKTIVIEPDGKIEVHDVIPALENLQKLVGGDIEAIRFTDDAAAYVNEDGKGLGLPTNAAATALCKRYGVGLCPTDYIVGTMVILGAPDYDGNDTEVPQRLIDEIIVGTRTKQQHTKLPWLARKGDTFNPERTWGIVRLLTPDEHGCGEDELDRTEVIAEVYDTPGDNGQADAEFIAKAANCHDDFLATLKAVKVRLHFVGMPQEKFFYGRPDWQNEIAMIESAIAKAEALEHSRQIDAELSE